MKLVVKLFKNPFVWLGVILMSGYGLSDISRGMRNKNPGNIRWDENNDWRGQVGQDNAGFVIFERFSFGIRAIGKVIASYRRRGLVTIGQIIATYAPANENDTNSYILSVSKELGKPADHVIGDADIVYLVAAIIKHENGINPFSKSVISRWLVI